MNNFKKDTLCVPGANLYYKIRGSGRPLLMIHGANGSADVFTSIAECLADWYTVITYDRRGYSRSTTDDKNEEYKVETHSDDAHRLLAALTGEPVYVFASSAGGVIGIDLITRHPEHVRILIAHEPGLLQLLPYSERAAALKILDNVANDYINESIFTAYENFLSAFGIKSTEDIFSRLDTEQLEKTTNNMKYFMGSEVCGMRNYIHDMDALKFVLDTTSARIVIGGSTTWQEYYPYRCSVMLANYLGKEVVNFPGSHAGYLSDSEEFAVKLHQIFIHTRK